MPKKTLDEIFNSAGIIKTPVALSDTTNVGDKKTLDDIFQSSKTPTSQIPQATGESQSILGAGVSAGLESLTNVPRSAFEFGKGIVDIARHPVETAKGLFRTVKGGAERATREVLERIPATAERVKRVPESEAEATFNALGTALKERYGSLEALEKTATEDPFGFGVDVLATVTGGAGLVGKAGAVARGIEVVGKPVTRALGKAVTAPARAIKETAKSSVGQATGISRPTLSTIFKRGDDIKEAQALGLTRETLGKEVGTNVSTRLEELKDLGSAYDTIRQGTNIVEIKPTLIDDVLKQQGFEVRKGKIFTTRTSPTRNTTDINALQNLRDNWTGASKLTPVEFLNLRSDLAELAKFGVISGKTKASQTVAKAVRVELNKQGRGQLEGLKELDLEFASEKRLLDTVKKDWLDKDGTLKDSAYSKIANITQPNRTKVLARLEKIMPKITDQVEILRAIEDIERAKGLKVGTYLRGIVGGSAVVTGNVPAIIAAILAQPSFAVPLIRGLGLANNKIQPILNIVFRMMKDVNNLTVSGSALRVKIQEYIDNPKLGASVEDVSKKSAITTELQPLAKEARKFKTADEFVEKSDNIFFHGTKKDFDIFDVEKTKRGIFLTKDESLAKDFTASITKTGGQRFGPVKKVYLSPDAKIGSMEEFRKIDEDVFKQKYDALKQSDQITVVYNADVLKTEQQLTDFYNQAVKGKK